MQSDGVGYNSCLGIANHCSRRLPRQAVSNTFILKAVTKTLICGGTVENDRWCDILVRGGLDDQKMSNWDWKLDERIDLPQDDDYLRRGCPFRILDSTSH